MVDETTQAANPAFAAFIAAQQEIGNVTKNAKNTFFKTAAGKPSGYVDLAALTNAVNPVLNKHGLAAMQRGDVIEGQPVIITQIVHESGEKLPPSYYPVVTKDPTDPQKFGAGVTYARRYSLMLYMGIAAEDDDGNLAATPAPPKPTPQQELAKALKARGYDTKEKVANASQERWGKTAGTLTTTEIQTWITELTNTDEPDF